MKLNILVISKYKWRSRLKKHQDIKKIMVPGGFSSIMIDTIKKDAGKPEVVKGRITEAWFEKNISKIAKQGDYNFAIFQFSERDGKRWGVSDGIRGLNYNDDDFFGEAWVCSDEFSEVKFKDGTKRNKYTKVVPHEIAHELKRQGYTPQEIHHYDYKNEINNIEQFYKDMNKDVLANMLAKLAQLKLQLSKMLSAPKDIQPLVKRSADRVIAEMKRRGLPVRIAEGFRSVERQNELYAQGRTKPGSIVTNAKGGESYHNYGVAVDFVFTKDGYNAPNSSWKILGDVLKLHGFEWGGDWVGFVDRPHGEMRLGYSLKDFQLNKVDYSKFN